MCITCTQGYTGTPITICAASEQCIHLRDTMNGVDKAEESNHKSVRTKHESKRDPSKQNILLDR